MPIKKLLLLQQYYLKKKREKTSKNLLQPLTWNNGSYVWLKCKFFKNKWIKVNLSHQTENLQLSESVNKAINKLSPPWANPETKLPPCEKNDFFDTPFDFYEFNTVLESANEHSAPGMDGIDYGTIKKLPIKYRLILLDIYNELYKTGEYPDTWSQSFIHFVDKPGNKGVRPIALTSCLCKLFESLIKLRLQWWCEHHNILPKSQSGFRKGRSTYDNLVNLSLDAEKALSSDRHLLAAFLDVSGAFDNVNCDILLQKLASIGCSKNLIQFAKSILSNHQIKTEVLGEEFRTIGKGVPQGGVLSPLFYLIYTADIAKNLPKNVKISQFADDIEIHCSILPLKKCKKALEKAANMLKDNLLKLGLELSPQKTVLLDFNKKKIKPGETEISIDGHTIKSSATAKFLGVIFDYELTFKSHINVLKKSV